MKKKLSVGAWITCLAAVLTLISLIVYFINVGGTGYFHNIEVKNLVLFSILVIVMLLCAIILKTLDIGGAAGRAVDLVSGALQIGAAVLLAIIFINLISSRVEGLAFIYFSNADVIKEVQTAENLASATTTIADMVLYGVSLIFAIVGSFCSLRKKNS